MKFPKKANFLCEILARDGYQARVVGGYIRDIMKNFSPHELDMATDSKPEIVLDICQENDVQCIPTGLKHGTVTAIIDSEPIEITTLRQDAHCYGRHAEVAFINSWEEDARRRDFTINAMYLDNKLRLYDFFDGESDLNNNIVRFIGDPEQRIHEDYLRIMRYFRFLGYFDNLKLHQDSFNQAVMLSHNLCKISSERIRNELLKVLSSRARNIPIELMLKSKIFEKIGLSFHNIDTSKLYFSSDPIINLTVLMKLSNICDSTVLKGLKFRNSEQKIIGELLKYNLDNHFKSVLEKMIHGINTINIIHNNMQEIGQYLYIKLFEMHFCIEIKSFTSCNYDQFLENFRTVLSYIKLKKFPLNAEDIIDLGYLHQDIGIKLRLAKQLWIDSSCTLEKAHLIKLITN